MPFSRTGDHQYLNTSGIPPSQSRSGGTTLRPTVGVESREAAIRHRVDRLLTDNHQLRRDLLVAQSDSKKWKQDNEQLEQEVIKTRTHLKINPDRIQSKDRRNAQLIALFVDRLAYLMSLVARNPQVLGVELIPEYLLLLDRIPYLDGRLYSIGQQLKRALTHPSASIAVKLRNMLPSELEFQGDRMGLFLAKLQEFSNQEQGWLANTTTNELSVLSNYLELDAPYELKFVAAALSDASWLSLGDVWTSLPLDLRYTAVSTLDRSWISYMNLWRRSPHDLRFIAYLYNDLRWLHNATNWGHLPVSEKLRAVIKRDPIVGHVSQILDIEDKRCRSDCCCRNPVDVEHACAKQNLLCMNCPMHCGRPLNAEDHPQLQNLQTEVNLARAELEGKTQQLAYFQEQNHIMTQHLAEREASLIEQVKSFDGYKQRAEEEFHRYEKDLQDRRGALVGQLKDIEMERLAELELDEKAKRRELEELRSQAAHEIDSERRLAHMEREAEASRAKEDLTADRQKLLREMEATKTTQLDALKREKDDVAAELEAMRNEANKNAAYDLAAIEAKRRQGELKLKDIEEKARDIFVEAERVALEKSERDQKWKDEIERQFAEERSNLRREREELQAKRDLINEGIANNKVAEDRLKTRRTAVKKQHGSINILIPSEILPKPEVSDRAVVTEIPIPDKPAEDDGIASRLMGEMKRMQGDLLGKKHGPEATAAVGGSVKTRIPLAKKASPKKAITKKS